MPSIACLKDEQPNHWRYHFVLVKQELVLADQEAASHQARQDLSAAFGQGGQPAPESVATELKKLGYKSVDGFKVVQA